MDNIAVTKRDITTIQAVPQLGSFVALGDAFVARLLARMHIADGRFLPFDPVFLDDGAATVEAGATNISLNVNPVLTFELGGGTVKTERERVIIREQIEEIRREITELSARPSTGITGAFSTAMLTRGREFLRAISARDGTDGADGASGSRGADSRGRSERGEAAALQQNFGAAFAEPDTLIFNSDATSSQNYYTEQNATREMLRQVSERFAARLNLPSASAATAANRDNSGYAATTSRERFPNTVSEQSAQNATSQIGDSTPIANVSTATNAFYGGAEGDVLSQDFRNANTLQRNTFLSDTGATNSPTLLLADNTDSAHNDAVAALSTGITGAFSTAMLTRGREFLREISARDGRDGTDGASGSRGVDGSHGRSERGEAAALQQNIGATFAEPDTLIFNSDATSPQNYYTEQNATREMLRQVSERFAARLNLPRASAAASANRDNSGYAATTSRERLPNTVSKQSAQNATSQIGDVSPIANVSTATNVFYGGAEDDVLSQDFRNVNTLQRNTFLSDTGTMVSPTLLLADSTDSAHNDAVTALSGGITGAFSTAMLTRGREFLREISARDGRDGTDGASGSRGADGSRGRSERGEAAALQQNFGAAFAEPDTLIFNSDATSSQNYYTEQNATREMLRQVSERFAARLNLPSASATAAANRSNSGYAGSVSRERLPNTVTAQSAQNATARIGDVSPIASVSTATNVFYGGAEGDMLPQNFRNVNTLQRNTFLSDTGAANSPMLLLADNTDSAHNDAVSALSGGITGAFSTAMLTRGREFLREISARDGRDGTDGASGSRGDNFSYAETVSRERSPITLFEQSAQNATLRIGDLPSIFAERTTARANNTTNSAAARAASDITLASNVFARRDTDLVEFTTHQRRANAPQRANDNAAAHAFPEENQRLVLANRDSGETVSAPESAPTADNALPQWASNFLKKSFSDDTLDTSNGRSMIDPMSARNISSVDDIRTTHTPSAAEPTMTWSAPGATRPQSDIVLRGKDSATQQPPPPTLSNAEINRMASKVYDIIEKRISLERRRLGR